VSFVGVKQIFTSARHPQSNSRCEAFNKNILQSLRTQCESHKKDWPSLLSTIGFSFRSSVVTSLGYSPYEIVFGFPAMKALDNLLLPSPNLPNDVDSYFRNMAPQLKILRETVRQNQIKANEKTEKAYNVKRNTKIPTFKPSDRVWLHNPKTVKEKLGHKIAKPWDGPYLILESNPTFHTYKLQDCRSQKILQSWVNARRLRAFDVSRDRLYAKNNTVLQTDQHTDAQADRPLHNMPSDEQQHQAATAESDAGTAVQSSAILQATPGEIVSSYAGETSGGESESASLSRSKQLPSADSTTAASSQDDAAPEPAAAAAAAAAATTTTTTDNGMSDWHTIKDIIRHKRNKGKCYYQVRWLDDTLQWLKGDNVTDTATDHYWMQKNATKKTRRRRHR